MSTPSRPSSGTPRAPGTPRATGTPSTSGGARAGAVPRWLLTVYRVFAYVTGVALLTLTIALIALLGTEPKPEWYPIAWTLHGWAYMGYLGSGFAVCFLMRWNIGRTLLVLAAGTVPAMSFVAERWVVAQVRSSNQPTGGRTA